MLGIASLSRSASRVVALAFAAAVLAAACGGGDDGPAPDDQADTQSMTAQTGDSEPITEPADDPAESPADTLTLPRVELARLLVDTVGVEGHGLLRAISAEPADPARLLAGLRESDGTPVDTASLVGSLGISDAFQAVYSGVEPERLQVVTIDVLGFEGSGGATALLDLIRAQPPQPGQRVVAPPPGVALDPVRITVYDVLADPNPPSPELIVGLHRTALLTVFGANMVRVEFLAGVPDPLPEVRSLSAVAAQVVERIAEAEAGAAPLPALDLPFPRVDLTELRDSLPAQFQGFETLAVDGDAGRLVVRYINPSGDFMVGVVEAFGNAAALRLRDVAVLRPEGIAFYTGAAPAGWELLDAEPLPAAAQPGTLGSGGRWHVRIDEVELYDDVLAFERGTVWVILQGVSAAPGDTPVIDLAFLIDDLLIDLVAPS